MAQPYRLGFKPSVERDLKKIPANSRLRILRRIEALAANPRPSGTKKIEDPSTYRVRQGSYRIVYEVDDQKRIMTIFKIGHRRWRGKPPPRSLPLTLGALCLSRRSEAEIPSAVEGSVDEGSLAEGRLCGN